MLVVPWDTAQLLGPPRESLLYAGDTTRQFHSWLLTQEKRRRVASQRRVCERSQQLYS